MSEQLKPCPFCGVFPVWIEAAHYWLACNCRNEHRSSPNRSVVFEYWNTRPIEDELNQRVKELEEQLEDIRLEAKNERD